MFKGVKNNFEDFIPDVKNNVFRNKYGISLAHFPEDKDEGINQFKRRIKLFNEIFQSNKTKVFVYINEDYIYSEKNRKKEFNDDIFSQMLELDLYLKEKLKNNYIILYFHWKKEKIPSNSNIINVVLNAKELFNDTESAHKNNLIYNFRNYCGEILGNMFKTL
jgi:hypothetical protein